MAVSVGVGEGELLAFYRRIIEGIRIPVIVQDASGYVGRPMPIVMQARLLDEFGGRVPDDIDVLTTFTGVEPSAMFG